MRTLEKSTTTEDRILARMKRLGPRAVVIVKDFADLGSREAVAQALTRLTKEGKLRRLLRGVYDVPQTWQFGNGPTRELFPDAETLVAAIARRNGERLMMAGGKAANVLGLSEQVPLRYLFLTDGPSRIMRMGNLEIAFRHVPPKEFPKSGDERIGMVLQALKNLGPGIVQEERLLRKLREALTPTQRQTLVKDAVLCPPWIRDLAREVAADA